MRSLIVLIAMLLPVHVWGQTTSYHIGNSLTWDSQPMAMELFGDEFGLAHLAGHHIHNGWPLKAFVNDPNTVTITPVPEFGKYSEALVNAQWDAVTLQPHFTQASTLEEDIDSIVSFIDLTRSNPANTDTTFYIYESWPNRLLQSYQEKWTAPLPAGANPSTVASREYFDLLYESVIQETNAKIRTIPVGEVLYQLDIDMQQGLVPGYTSITQVYRDVTHLNNEIGRYIASATTFSTLSGAHPLSLYKPPGFVQENLFPLSEEVYKAVNTVIRDVLNADLQSGVYYPVADFDGSGVIGSKDLASWEASYPGLQYDLDNDGKVTGLDFLTWQNGATKNLDKFVDSPANLDGLGPVDSEDLAIWLQAYGVNGNGDLDSDGDTDGLDFLQIQVALSPFDPADVNKDRKVDGTELNLWEASYGFDGIVDADGDNVATGLDFLIWQREAGMSAGPTIPSVSVVPEPGLALQVAMLITLLVSGRATRFELRRSH